MTQLTVNRYFSIYSLSSRLLPSIVRRRYRTRKKTISSGSSKIDETYKQSVVIAQLELLSLLLRHAGLEVVVVDERRETGELSKTKVFMAAR